MSDYKIIRFKKPISCQSGGCCYTEGNCPPEWSEGTNIQSVIIKYILYCVQKDKKNTTPSKLSS